MDEKLKELTDIIVQEGVDKAESKSKEIVDQAQHDANEILRKARQESDDTVALAQKRAEEIRKNAESELKLASQQIIASLKQQITDLVLVKMLAEPISDLFDKPEFLGQLITETVKAWNPKGAEQADLKALLPEKSFKEVEKFLKQKAAAVMKDGLKIEADKKMQTGFQVAPVDGGFKLNFSDSEFTEFFKTFLRTKTQSLLFGGE